MSDAWLVYQSHQVRRYKWSPDGGRRGGAWVEAPAITPGAVGVAMRRTVFGEGAERMVRKFREIGRDGVFVGPKMVAKESRFVEDLRSRDLIKFHEVFSKTQAGPEPRGNVQRPRGRVARGRPDNAARRVSRLLRV